MAAAAVSAWVTPTSTTSPGWDSRPTTVPPTETLASLARWSTARTRRHYAGQDSFGHPDYGGTYRRRGAEGGRAGPARHPGRAGRHGQGVPGGRGRGHPRPHPG